MYPNPFKNKDAVGLNQARNAPEDMEASQDLADTFIKSRDRYNLSLNYTQQETEVNNSSGTNPSLSNDKDLVKPDIEPPEPSED